NCGWMMRSSSSWRVRTPVRLRYRTFGSLAAPRRSPFPTASTKRRNSVGRSTRFAIEHDVAAPIVGPYSDKQSQQFTESRSHTSNTEAGKSLVLGGDQL